MTHILLINKKVNVIKKNKLFGFFNVKLYDNT